MAIYIGIDPGGKNSTGWCVIEADAESACSIIASGTVSEAYEAVSSIEKVINDAPIGAGIDSPLYWVMSKERVADREIRRIVKNAGGHSATVGHVNSLRGACLVQGVLSAVILRDKWPNLQVTESHPKALIVVQDKLVESLRTLKFRTEHERDAYIAAFSAWQSAVRSEGWKNWVESEESAVFYPSGFEVEYWFPSWQKS